MCLYVYDMFHILLSGDSQGSMECIHVFMYVWRVNVEEQGWLTELTEGVRILWQILIQFTDIFLCVKNRKINTSKHKKLQSNKDQLKVNDHTFYVHGNVHP